MTEVKEIPVEKIQAGEHAQRLEESDEAIDELVASIRRVGIIQPLVVVGADDRYTLVAGHRRFTAAKRAGLQVVPCMVSQGDQCRTKETAFAENLFRKDLSPLELGGAVKDCLDLKIMTADELAAGLHRSTEWLRRMVAMLDWPADVLNEIHAGWLSVSAAHNLALVEDDVYRGFLLRNALDSGATARTTAAWLQAWRSMAPAEEAVQAPPVDGQLRTAPMVPQAPCIACGQVYRTDQLSHVPVCAGCIQAIRNVGHSG